MSAEKIRESVIAGTWYPGDPASLKKQISGYLDQAKLPEIKGRLTGLISPHAGYMYSGGVAAYAYKLLAENPVERVVIIAPSHQTRFSGSSIYNLGGYRTPLGIAPLDFEIIEDLFKHSSLVRYVPQADQQEHSLEIQLPFLQSVLPRFKLVPIVMGDQDYHHCSELAEVLATVIEKKPALIVASTDLSHYHPYDDARALDKVLLDRIEAFDLEGLDEDIRTRRCEACGAGPVLTMMLAARKMGADSVKLLHYANSGDVTGDVTGGVVGYMAAAVYKAKESDRHGSRAGGIDLGFDSREKETLRKLAYHAIRSRCLGEPMPDIPAESEKLKQKRGAFVCIHKGSDLRGCIGVIEPAAPLSDTIKRMAVEAAFNDPRFCSLSAAELDEIDIEISVLTPLERISDPSTVEIGKHGLLVRSGYHSGLLLPQVPVEQGWDRTQFLEGTCRKAGLAKNAWKKPDVELYSFSADII